MPGKHMESGKLPPLFTYEPGDPETSTPPSWFIPLVPAEMLMRHDARVLDPTTAVEPPPSAHDDPPAPTVYRRRVLLLPTDQRKLLPERGKINDELKELGLILGEADPADERSFTLGGRHAAPLRVRDQGKAVEVDAWAARQQMKAAAANGRLDSDLVDQIRLDHLLFGTAFIPTLTGAPGGILDPSGKGTALGSYVRSTRGGPIPVRVLMDPPDRGPVGTNRRPVIAVLDTGIAEHPWFPETYPETSGVSEQQDPFIITSQEVQDAIRNAGPRPSGAAGQELDTIADERDTPIRRQPLVGDVSSHYGHGTFINGIIRQIAPRAQVLAIRVMRSDGVVYESELVTALRWLVNVKKAGTQEVDIVSLSLGYYDESGTSGFRNGDLAKVIEELSTMGVQVIAAAGNDATERCFLPAALPGSRPDGKPTVLSVGAFNPNGTRALFSNEASWVRSWATGAAIVSTYPIEARGGREPIQRANGNREALDEDDFRSGFAVWDGTSFAAPIAAAMLANEFIERANRGDGALADGISTLEPVGGNARG